ncbi:hypothetical protein B0H13DRAFT_1921990 [Mycena leptocephala]|nr:hypothetical protein B0H13DRAFT_1921990 [Mycena leptocephala]
MSSPSPARTAALTDAQDKAFKLELAAKKARVTALMDMRARTLKSARRRWPQPRCLSKDHERENLTRQMEEKAALEAAKAEKRLCPNSRLTTHHLPAVYSVTFPLLYCDVSVGRGADRLVCTLASRPELPPLVTRTSVLAVKSLEFRPTFYAHIDSLEWARVLPKLKNLRKLATAHHVPLEAEVIPYITFRLHSFTSFSAVIGPWVAFIAMQTELQELVLHSDFLASAPAPACLPMLRRLKARYDNVARFSEYGGLTDIWVWLGRPNPGPPFPTRAIAKLAASPTRLTSLRANGPQLKMLLHMAPALLHGLRHLVLDEDRLLCGFNQNAVELVRHTQRGSGARSPDPAFTNLKDGMLLRPVFSALWNEGPARVGQHGYIFAREMVAIHQAPSLHTLHFCAVDGCATWRKWGGPDEVVYVTLPLEHPPWVLNPEY